MAELNLDSIRTAAEAKYANLTISLGGDDKVTLLNPLHMTREARDRLMKLQESLGGDDDDAPEVDQQAVFEDTIRVVALGMGGDRLVKAIGGNLAVLAETMEQYNETCQVGEA